DNLDVNTLASTISGARETINDLVKSIKEDGSSDFNKYIYKNNKKLRMGYTTGSCAAAATKAATIMLISGKKLENISIITPKGIKLNLNIHDIDINKDFVSCGVKKDSGDDPDVTNGLLIYAKVSKSGKTGINISGGEGVGRVTKKGLECSVGEAAINKVPRSMIEYEVKSIIDECEYKLGVDVEIYVPGGEEIAKRTFNKRLGIIGGISILGTSGIVEPMSEKALIDSFKLEMRILYEEGFRYIILTPGNYGQTFVKDNYNIDEKYIVKVSNFIGEALDYAKELNFNGILIIGHMGKFIKLAGGIMNTHSKYADCRMEIIAANAALEGAGIDVINNIMQCITTDEAIEWLDSIDIRQKVMNRVINKIDFYINNRVYESVNLGAVMFSNIYGVLCSTNKCLEIIKQIKKQEKQL
ncbi:MAG: cobalt-precorrin-5B (C(1))-methyltransferase CbiD, partial [Clostridium sp.]